LQNLVSTGQLPYPSLIFVQSIERANELHKTLVLDGLRCDVVHSSRGKAARDEAIKGFREGRVWVLVVTEVLARGMDFRGVKVVVNYGEFLLEMSLTELGAIPTTCLLKDTLTGFDHMPPLTVN
jgi:superfamily II DNA/RNA helicase